MSLPGRIILHVGAQKTGSTYLQRRMRNGAAELRAAGIYVPVLPEVERIAGNAKLLANALNGEASIGFAHVFPNIDLGTLDPARVVADLLADWRPEREILLLSAETFRAEHAPVVRSLLPSRADICVILSVRRQDRWIESYYQQLVKTGDFRNDIQTFVEVVLGRQEDRFCYPDWEAQHEAWLRAFGSCQVVFYDEAKSDLFNALFHAAELEAPPGIPDLPPQQVSVDQYQLAYLLELDLSLSYVDYMRQRIAATEASHRLGAPEPRTLLSSADRRWLIERFSDSNARFLQAVGRSSDDPVLRLDLADKDCTTLEEIYASAEYQAHKTLAQAIFAGEL